jgi:hypothetical protein
VFVNQECCFIDDAARTKSGENSARIGLCVRRVSEHQVKPPAQACRRLFRGDVHDGDLLGDTERARVFIQRLRGWTVRFDERHVRGTARDRLKSERTAPGIQIEDVCIGEPGGEDGKQRLFDACGGRTNGAATWGGHTPAPERSSGDDQRAHYDEVAAFCADAP